MNTLCLGARVVGEETAIEIVVSFVNACFIDDERFTRRVNKIKQLEKLVDHESTSKAEQIWTICLV